MNTEKRSMFWENYKGILILLVVFGHFIYAYAMNVEGSLAETLYKFIYTFHMPAFIFCSGYLSKSENSRSQKSLLKLFLYYVIFNTLMLLYTFIAKGSSMKFLTPLYSYWYILSLIFWRLSIGRLSKIKGIIPLSLAITLILGFYGEFSNLLSIRRTIAFFIFFLLGYKFDKERFEKFISGRKPIVYILGVLLTVAASAAVFYVIKNHTITNGMLLMSKYTAPKDMIKRVFLMITAIVAIIALFMIVPDRKIPLLSNFGKNSLLIYLAHRFITLVFANIFPPADYSRMYLVYAGIATIITCILFGFDKMNSAFSKLVGKAAGNMLDTEKNTAGDLLKSGSILLFIALMIVNLLIKN